MEFRDPNPFAWALPTLMCRMNDQGFERHVIEETYTMVRRGCAPPDTLAYMIANAPAHLR